MNTQKTCPICGKELKDNELLVLRYYAPKDWWVTYHLKPSTTKENPYPVWTHTNQNYELHCCQAGIEKVVPV